MKFIGNIVTVGSKRGYSPLFNVVGTIDDAIVSIPTMVVGRSMSRNCTNTNKMQRNNGNLRWTFAKTEDRAAFNEDINEFYRYCLNKSLETTKYVYVDFLKYTHTRIRKMLLFAGGNEKKLCFLTRKSNFLFVYCPKYNTVFGVSMTLCEYLGIERKKVLDTLSNTQFITPSEFIDDEMREIIGSNTHYILPLYTYFF